MKTASEVSEQGREEKKSEHLSGRYYQQLPNGLTSLARCVTFTSWMLLYNEKKKQQKTKNLQQESHATLKSKLQIQLKMNIYEV